MKYRVNDGCIGCVLCADTCPQVFSMTDEGLAKAIESEVAEADKAAAAEAKDLCSVSVIEEI